MRSILKRNSPLAVVAVLAVAVVGGCDPNELFIDSNNVPEPFVWLLPDTIEIHFFTKTRTPLKIDGEKVTGLLVHIQAKDVTGVPVKAFGEFRIEAYAYRPNHPDPKGKMREYWTIPLNQLKDNLAYWDPTSKTYAFPLQWSNPIPVGEKLMLVAVFDSPYTRRMSTERQFVSGE